MKRGHDVATGTNLPDLFANAGVAVAMVGPAKLKRKKKPKPKATIEARFAAFHKANPELFREIETRAAALVARDVKRLAVRMVIESVRYECAVRKDDPKEFNINDNYISRYARLLLERHPDWTPLIETRSLRSA